MTSAMRFGETDAMINESFDIIQAHGADLDQLYAAWRPFWLRLLALHPATAPASLPAREAAIA